MDKDRLTIKSSDFDPDIGSHTLRSPKTVALRETKERARSLKAEQTALAIRLKKLKEV